MGLDSPPASHLDFLGYVRHPADYSEGVVDIIETEIGFQAGGEQQHVPLVKRVTKSIDIPSLSPGYKYFLARLFRSELENLTTLNRLGNPYVPRVVDADEKSYEMEFIYGETGNQLKPGLNRETQLFILNQTLSGVKAVFDDGFISLEYAPKNTIVRIDYSTGKPTGVKLIDWGLSYPISAGLVEIDVGLLKQLDVKAEIIPPEARGYPGVAKIGAEAALVWSLARRIVPSWLTDIDFHLSSISRDPKERPSLVEFISHYKSLPCDQTKIESCVEPKKLAKIKKLLGRPDTEITISETELEALLHTYLKSKPVK